MTRASRLLALPLAVGLSAAASARPTYFEVLTSTFGFTEGDRLYACGVCHYKWEGTGARNPFGTTVEQQLYLGKPIAQALQDAVGEDPDADGFTSLDELQTHETLPGFSCANFFDSQDPPADWHTFVTPGVASCLEPKDVRVAPVQLAFSAVVGRPESVPVTVYNNGSTAAIQVTSYGFLPGSPPSLTISGPPPPFSLAYGENAVLEVRFAPETALLAGATLRVASDDPDEPTLDVALTLFAAVRPLASVEKRAACLRDVERESRRYAKKHLAEWVRCQSDEARGLACRAGARDIAIQKAEDALRAVLGGARDRHCAAAGISPTLLGHPDRCGGGCDAIELDEFGDLADCLVCRQGEETAALLAAGLGAAPPDLPPRPASPDAERCQARLLSGVRKAADKAQGLLGRCELDNVTADEPVDCAAANAVAVESASAQVDERFARCKDSAGLGGCFADGGDPACLGDAGVAAAADLVDAAFGLAE